MFVTRKEYEGFGHDLIPEAKFLRTINKAGMIAQQHTLGRLPWEANSASQSDDSIAEWNKMGICELADLIYTREAVAIGASGAPIVAFRNESYSETISSDRANPVELELAYNKQIGRIIAAYFTPEQRSRVGGG